MLIILEGPDGSGKTTLKEALEKNFYNTIHISRHNNIEINTFLNLAKSNSVFIIDRCTITSWVYRILRKEKLDSDDYVFSDVLNILKRSKIIYCTNKNSFKNSMSRGENNIVTIEEANKLRQMYDFVISTIKLYNLSKVFDYDWEKQSVDDVIKFIKESI